MQGVQAAEEDGGALKWMIDDDGGRDVDGVLGFFLVLGLGIEDMGCDGDWAR